MSTSRDKAVNTVYRNNRYLFSHTKKDKYTVSAKCRGLDKRYLRCTSKRYLAASLELTKSR